jgi:hypothetical protein
VGKSDGVLKVLIGTACLAVIAAVGFYFYTTWASQPSEIDKSIAEMNAISQELHRRHGF